MGYVYVKATQHVKYESYVINSFQDNKQKPCVQFYKCPWPETKWIQN